MITYFFESSFPKDLVRRNQDQNDLEAFAPSYFTYSKTGETNLEGS
jgi:hypothetical protein